jgi:hypothetical protein
MTLERVSDDKFWNGTTWVADWGQAILTATLSTHSNPNSRTWTFNSGPPSSALMPGNYHLHTQCYDQGNSQSGAGADFTVVGAVPTVSITSPASGSTVSSLQTLSGTITDADGSADISRVDMNIGRVSDSKFWNGTTWVSNWWQAILTATLSPHATPNTRTWTFNGGPPATELTDGGYFIHVHSYDLMGNNSGADANYSVGHPLPLDARLAPGHSTTPPLSDSAFVGLGIANFDAANQSVTRSVDGGAASDFTLSILKGAGSDTVTVTAPAMTDSWNANYFFGEQDITSSVNGTGWSHAFAAREEVRLRVEVTPASGATQDEVQSVLIRVQGAISNGSGYDTDTVKAIVSANIAVQPDLSIRPITEIESLWMGEGELSTNGTNQILSDTTMLGATHSFALRVKNTGSVAKGFNLTIATPPTGWITQLFDALEAGNEISLTPTGYTTPVIAAGQSLELRLEITAPIAVSATDSYEALVKAKSGTLVDAVKIASTVQKIAKFQWSYDGTIWYDFSATDPPEVGHMGTIGVRAVKSAPDLDWPEPRPVGPKWKWQGQEVEGQEVWLKGETLTGEVGDTVEVEYGHSLSQKIQVTASYRVALSVSQSSVMAGAGPADFKTVTISAQLTDDDHEAAKAGVRVRFRGLNAGNTSAGEIGSTLPADDVVLTDAEGVATVVWTSSSDVGEIKLEAMPLDDKGFPRGAGDSVFVQSSAPYSRIQLGEWVETNGAWSRSVTVSTWFLSEKVAGRGVTLSSQVIDSDTEQPLTGWQNAAPFDVATGTTNASGDFTTVQRWVPVEAGAEPDEFEVEASASVN